MKSLPYQLAVTLLIAAMPLACLRAEQPAPAAPGGGTSTAPAGKPQKDPSERRKERFEQMKQELGLTDEQSTKIGEIMKSDFDAMKAVKDDQSLSEDARKAKIKELRKASEDKVNALLTPEQVTKRDALKAEHMKERKDAKP